MPPSPKLRSSLAALSSFGVLVIFGVLVGGATVVVSAARPAAAVSKVTICHRTHSTSNPYRRISVSTSAVNASSTNDHTHHTGSLFQPGYRYPPSQKVWGDIIPGQSAGGAGQDLNGTTSEQSPTPTPIPTVTPTADPTVAPTADPTTQQTVEPTIEPTVEPTTERTSQPTTSPTNSPVGPLAQSLSGLVWLDLNSNGRQDANEPGLPGIAVQLTQPATSNALRAFEAALLRPHTGTDESVRTDSTGRFSLASLPAGTYCVTADRPSQLGVTYDSEGTYDATATVLLPTGGQGRRTPSEI